MRAQDLLGTELPIIQAPMAGSQGSRLCVAVCSAGGLGSMPAAAMTPQTLHDELQVLAAQAGGTWNVNFFAHTPSIPDAVREAGWRARLAPYFAEHGIDVDKVPTGAGRQPFTHEVADVLEPFKPAIVSFHFGLPAAPGLLQRVRSWGSRILSSATTVDEALWLQEQGVDAVIAQGLEAGGHRGHFLDHDLSLQQGLMGLLPQLVSALRIPVIAAGGIADARGVMAALALGATAVQMGTAYLLCPEATTSTIHRVVLRSRAARNTALTNLVTGRPARGIVNRVMREIGPLSSDAPAFPFATAAIAPLRAAAEAQGNGDFSPLWAGQNIGNLEGADAASVTRALAQLID